MRDLASYLDLAKSGRREAALNGMIDLGESAIPGMAEAYRAQADPRVRAVLVEAAWQLRSPASIAVLAEALQDPEPIVWRQALDGLVTLASRESLDVLESARDRLGEDRDDFREWVDGALEDVRGRIDE